MPSPEAEGAGPASPAEDAPEAFAAAPPVARRTVVPAPVYQVLSAILAFTVQVDEAWTGEKAPPATADVVDDAEEDFESGLNSQNAKGRGAQECSTE